MKKNLLYFIALLLLSVSVQAQKKQAQISAIAFYNLENLFYPAHDTGKSDYDFTPDGAYHYTWDIYKQKLHNMAYAISQIAIDVTPDGPVFLGVAEIENEKVLQDLAAQPELKTRNLQIVHFESPDIRGIDVAFLYNPAYFRVLRAQALPLILKKDNKRIYTRDVLYVKGIFAGTDTMHVMVCHWPSRYGGEAATIWERRAAAQLCKDKYDAVTKANPAARVVIMGDLNDDPISPSIAQTLGATGNKKAAGDGAIFNPWIAYYKKGIGTLGYSDSWNLFDQIMLSSGFLQKESSGWHFYQAHIFNKAFLKTAFGRYKGYPHRSFSNNTWIDGYSDHFPTYIYLIKEVQ